MTAPLPPRRTGIAPRVGRPRLTPEESAALQRLVDLSDIDRERRREEALRAPERGRAGAEQTRTLVSYLLREGVPRSRKELDSALRWISDPNAKLSEMPSEALVLDLLVGLTPLLGEAQSGRDLWRDVSQGETSGWTVLAAAGVLPIFGYVKDAETFARNLQRVTRGADITRGRALAGVAYAGEKLTGEASVKIGNVVFRGANHQDARLKAVAELGEDAVRAAYAEQGAQAIEGFPTSARPHVSRVVGQTIAEQTGQTRTRLMSGNLTTEQMRAAQGLPVSPAAQRALANAEQVPEPPRPEVAAIRAQFPSSDDLRLAPWKGVRECAAGHCYAASEALYHMLGGKEAGWKPMHMKVEVEGRTIPHWFLQNENTGEVLDVTADQFPFALDYSQAKGKGFQTKDPSLRARMFIQRAQRDYMPQIPIESKSHLLVPALRDAPPAFQEALRDEIQGALTGENGEDLVARILGVDPVSVDPGTGVWEGSRTPNSVYTFLGLDDTISRKLAVAHSIARGQEAATWWRLAQAGEDATPGIVVRNISDAQHARLAEIAPELGSTHVGNEALFVNFSGDPQFEQRITEALTAVVDDASDFTLHQGQFHSEYIGSPEEFRAVFSDPQEYRDVVGGLVELTAPIYRGTAEQLGDLDRYAPAMRDYLNRILPEERIARYTGTIPEEAHKMQLLSDAQRQLADEIFSTLPEARVMASGALAGIAKRGWYEASARAIAEVFGPDASRFAALLASLSPQTSVENNLSTALEMWANWTAAGRPVNPDAIDKILEQSVPFRDLKKVPVKDLRRKVGRAITELGVQAPLPPRTMKRRFVGPPELKTPDLLSASEAREWLGALPEETQRKLAVLPGWRANTITSLSATDPGAIMLSGPKVDSFMRNLLGDTERVTLDTWMARLANVKQKIFSGKKLVGDVGPGQGPGYFAYSARVRETADLLTRMTGEVWSPAEVQEALWSWGWTLGELSGGGRKTTFAAQIPNVTAEALQRTPTFNELLLKPANARRLERMQGAGEKIGQAPQIPMKGGVVPEGGVRPADLEQLAENLFRSRNDDAAIIAMLGAGAGGSMLAAGDDDTQQAGLGLLGFSLLGPAVARQRIGRLGTTPNRWLTPDLGYLGDDARDVPTFLRRARQAGIAGEPSAVAQEYYRSKIFGGAF